MEAKPIGTIRISTVGGHRQRVIKISHHGSRWRRWQSFASHWWTINRGPIPDGYRVYHRNGDSLDDSPDNLVLAREDRLKLVLSRRPANRRRLVRQKSAVAKSNRERARVYNSFLRPLAWYVVLPASMAILWVPCRSRVEAKELFSPAAIAELCAKDEAILKWRDLRPRNIEPFQVGHPVLYRRGKEIDAESGQDGQFEGFIRLIPDTRKPPRKRVPKLLPPDLVTVCGDGYLADVIEPLSDPYQLEGGDPCLRCS